MARIPTPPDGFPQRVAKQLVRVTPQIVAPANRGVCRPQLAFARLSQSAFRQVFMYHLCGTSRLPAFKVLFERQERLWGCHVQF